MPYQALYRKYRPHTFNDFIDQDNVKRILVNSIKNNKISHAYLFSGSRGIGKTSMAKIFAKAINCLNFTKNNDVCEECENCIECDNQCVDIIEIDAASNNGVDQIRDLKNRISIVPTKLKYKVYIIDEVHMLTNSAFNALLKTLEEPPEHAIFILATTEFYEVPETIVSRCQCFNFTRISIESLVKRLKFIAEKEKISIDDDVIKEIALYSNGGLRDAIGMLDKLNSFTNDNITLDIYKSLNGMISSEDVITFYNSSVERNLKQILEIINKIEEQGYDFKNFVERVMIFTRDKIIESFSNNKIKIDLDLNINLVDCLNDILNRLKDAVNPLIIMEVFMIKFINQKEKVIISQEIKNESNISREIADNGNDISREMKKEGKNISREIKNKEETNKKMCVVDENIKKIRINNTMATANMSLKKEMQNSWKKIDEYFMDEKFNKVAQLLFDTTPMVVGENYAILTSENDAIIQNIYDNFEVVEDFLNKIYKKINVVIINNDEFEIVKSKYIDDKKKNINYQVQEEYGKLVNVQGNLINKALDVFGSDYVEIE